MMTSSALEPRPAERAEDVERISSAMRATVREAVPRRKRLGNPVAAWRGGRVVWLHPHEIALLPDGLETGGA